MYLNKYTFMINKHEILEKIICDNHAKVFFLLKSTLSGSSQETPAAMVLPSASHETTVPLSSIQPFLKNGNKKANSMLKSLSITDTLSSNSKLHISAIGVKDFFSYLCTSMTAVEMSQLTFPHRMRPSLSILGIKNLTKCKDRHLKKIYILIFFLFCAPTFSDIQKNKLVQHAITVKKGNIEYYNVSALLKNQEALEVTVDIFFERYKNEKINAFLSTNDLCSIIAEMVGKKMGIPVYKTEKMPPYLENIIHPNQKFILFTDILYDGTYEKSIIEWIESKNAYLMEVACLTEDIALKGRENIPAQVMSIFIKKPQKKS
jgi:adenine/guanine phosphoribosyltransferase-like PRPP-binding protein